jgi:hypothetical protein
MNDFFLIEIKCKDFGSFLEFQFDILRQITFSFQFSLIFTKFFASKNFFSLVFALKEEKSLKRVKCKEEMILMHFVPSSVCPWESD